MASRDDRPASGGTERVAIEVTPTSRVLRDADAVRLWFDPVAPPRFPTPFVPRAAALEILKASAPLLGGDQVLEHLREGPMIVGEDSYSVRFHQEFAGLPVDGSDVIFNIFSDGRVASVFNQYHYGIPLDPALIRVTRIEAGRQVSGLFRTYAKKEIGAATLIVYKYHPGPRQHRFRGQKRPRHRHDLDAAVRASLTAARRRGFRLKPNAYYFAWGAEVLVERPRQHWRVLIDASSGSLITLEDLLAYNGPDDKGPTGMIFDPNPVVTSGKKNLSWSHGKVLDDLRTPVDLDRLDSPDHKGKLHLNGTYVFMEDLGNTNRPLPASHNGHFVYGAKSDRFLDVMAYFHIDRFQAYVQKKLGLSKYGSLKVGVDTKGEPNNDRSTWGLNGICFGKGSVPDASDALIILHEYGHALQNHVNAGSGSGNFAGGLREGFADFLAATFYDDAHSSPKDTRGIMFSWGANPENQRSYRVTWRFDDPGLGTDGYKRGQFWCATMFELYRKLGGDSLNKDVRGAARALVIRLHLVANEGIPPKFATADQAAAQVYMLDTHLAGWLGDTGVPRYANGLHLKVISDTFSSRAIPGFPAPDVDVYIDDGRQGGYGSVKASPTFDDSLWLENHGDPPGLWVQVPGRAAGPPGAASAKVDMAADVFARVENLGGTNSGPLTVKAFVAEPGSARVWPIDWQILDPLAPSKPVADVAKNRGAAVIVGPFAWTPTKTGAHTLLVIGECGKDQAVTELLQAADRVPIMDLVPFDNNIAMREIQVTA